LRCKLDASLVVSVGQLTGSKRHADTRDMLNRMLKWLLPSLLAWPLTAGPLEFAKAELDRALADRGIKLAYKSGVSQLAPEAFEIEPLRITGGDLRGLMYGFLEAAEQIRARGRITFTKGSPATPMRGIRYFIHNHDLDERWYYSHEYWDEYFAMLARRRFNRFNLVFAHQTNYLAPPYPFWLDLPEFPEIRVSGLSSAQRQRNLEMLQYISQAAADHGIDFTLGVWEHNIQTRMTPTVEGITRENIGPYSRAALGKILRLCPAIRSVQMRTNTESGIPPDQQVEFYRDYVFPAIRDCGREVRLDLRAWAVAGGMITAAQQVGVPLRVSTKYWAEDVGRPYQPAETYPGYSYLNFLEKPRKYDFYWELWGLGSHRLLLWGDPDFVKRAVPTFHLSGSTGFEIDAPLAQKGFGNRPGTWDVFTSANKDRMFWKWEFERYWLFYLLWGRLSYDPKTPASTWMSELTNRFGAAAADVMEAYRHASRVINEIVAVHLADPNMYIWPEINPGGLLDTYKETLPSDWAYVASIQEAVRNRIEGVASAKQTSFETAARLNEMADQTERAVKRASQKLAQNAEWRSSEADFRVLAHLARYHALKQTAAWRVEYFDRTADGERLAEAARDINDAIKVWEDLVSLTDGLYPAEMAFGPDDIGHWKDKLPYVRHDKELIAGRQAILARFGRFDYGFDFGAPVEPAGIPAHYRDIPYSKRNSVEPRFEAVDPKSQNWTGEGSREASGIPLSPYLEVRAAAREPKQLPSGVLFRDFIRGSGTQKFQLKAPAGDYEVLFLHPDESVATQQAHSDGTLSVTFPDGEWNVSGLVIKGAGSREPPPKWITPKPLPRPTMTHEPPVSTWPGEELTLRLNIASAAHVTGVRLHYRPVNQLARFKTIEAKGPVATFRIPAEDVSAKWDLMYYFEVLNDQKTGWFQPDPLVATPYYVVKVAE
jgi:hypothetical protein